MGDSMLLAKTARRFLGFSRRPTYTAEAPGRGFLLEGPSDNGTLPNSLVAQHNGVSYRTPTDLCRTELSIHRVLIIGSCLSAEWMRHITREGLRFDYVLTNNVSQLPETPPALIDAYDFQIVQIPLRSVLHENTYSHLAQADLAAYENLFAMATVWLTQYLDMALAWNTKYGIQSFVTNFMVPQQSPLGRLLPRHDLRNMVHFIERLNGHLYAEIGRRSNVHLFDIDQISACVGKHTMQDDGVWTLSHGGVLNDCEYELDRARILPTPSMTSHYPPLAAGQRHFYEVAWAELVAMVRTLRQIDSVKLVVFDLDDTLWRGVVAEEGDVSSDTIEGWPVGLMEAACFLKKRGLLLAIISRNEEARIVSVFDRIVGGRLRLDDFAARRINWRLKTENMSEILAEVSLTPQSVVFIDDNPVERADMQARFPEIRCIGAHPYYLRRILLWSSETQVPFLTEESVRRTEMVQAQIARDQEKSSLSREAFLATLGLQMTIIDIRSTTDRRFARAFELINKTNQFNTTGRRLTRRECTNLFGSGCVFHAFELHDRFSHYGLVGVAIVEGALISQLVISCRVLGLGAEDALLAHIANNAAAAGLEFVSGRTRVTTLNAPVRDLYARHGFIEQDGAWRAPVAAMRVFPPHIHILHEPSA